MVDFATRFWRVFAIPALAGGLYFAAVAVNKTSVFYYIVAATFAAALLWLSFDKIRPMVKSYRNYPSLLTRAASLQQEVEQLKVRCNLLDDRAKGQWEGGVFEGRKQVLGAIFAATGALPTLYAVRRIEGKLILVAECSGTSVPPNGTRYHLRVAATGELRGVVEVVDRTLDPAQVFLHCVLIEADSSVFWQHLADSAQRSSIVPPDLELMRTTLRTEYSAPHVAAIEEQAESTQ